MILIISHSDDILSQNIYHLLKKNGNNTYFIDESNLFSKIQFSFHRNGKQINGFLLIQGKRIPFTEIEGVLLRLKRSWWPSPNLDLQDQVFIYHETIASWFSLFETFNCPVINRFPLGWWLQEESFLEMFRLSIAARLKISIAVSKSPLIVEYGFKDNQTSSSEEMESYYIAGNTLIPTSGSGSSTNTILSKKFPDIAAWLERNGVSFCRLDFKSNGVTELNNIELSPIIDKEPDIIIKKISKAITRRLS